jgi:hypothetical protein
MIDLHGVPGGQNGFDNSSVLHPISLSSNSLHSLRSIPHLAKTIEA